MQCCGIIIDWLRGNLDSKRLMVGLVSVTLAVSFTVACGSDDNSDATVIAQAVAATQTRSAELDAVGTSVAEGIAATQAASSRASSLAPDCSQKLQDMTSSERTKCIAINTGAGGRSQSGSQAGLLGQIYRPGSKVEISQGGSVTIDELIVQKIEDGTYRVSTNVTVVAGRGSKTVDPSMFVLVTQSGLRIRGEIAYTMLLPFILDHTTLPPFAIAAGYVSFPLANGRDLPDYVIFEDLDQNIRVDAVLSEQ